MTHPPSDSSEEEPGRPDPGQEHPPPSGPPYAPPPGPSYDYGYGYGYPPPYAGGQPYAGQQPYSSQPPYSGPPPYGGRYAPGTMPGGYGPPSPPTSNRATVAIVLGAVSLMACLGFVTGIPAIIVGFSARREIRESQGRLSGDSVALGGIIAGIAGTVLSLLAIGFIVLMLVLGANFETGDSGDFEITTSGQAAPTTR